MKAMFKTEICDFRYTNTGQLTCALCNQQLTSETFWKAHVNGREHKQVCLFFVCEEIR